MKIQSSAFENGAQFPEKYTCDGADVNPPLEFSLVHKLAESLAIIVEDIDSAGAPWIHWTIWNIRKDALKIDEGKIPTGAVEGLSTFGKTGYGGPCPHVGTHRYIFHLYALNSMLSLPAGSGIAELKSAMAEKIVDEAQITGIYQKKEVGA